MYVNAEQLGKQIKLEDINQLEYGETFYVYEHCTAKK